MRPSSAGCLCRSSAASVAASLVLVAGAVAVCVYFLFGEFRLLFTTNVNAEQKAWVEFALMMLGLGGIFGGFVLGGIYGAVRTFTNRKREEKGNGKS